jgi:hypothetical protein
VRFPNPGDGLQFVSAHGGEQRTWMKPTSDLESEHFAPESGYQPVWAGSTLARRDVNGDEVGYFRIRSQLAPDGKVLRAWYGKIYGSNANFVLSQRLILDYYLNPDGTRNVEWDPKRNLGGDFTNKP